MAILDHRGRPLEMEKLGEELAAPEIAGVRSAWYESTSNTLTPERLAEVILAAEANDIQAFLTLAEEMEERDLHYADVLGTRKLAVTGLEVMVESASDERHDMEIADAVRKVIYDDAFDALLPGVMDAIGKGFSVSEIMWDRSGKRWLPKEYKWRDPRFFQFDLDTGTEVRLRDIEDLAYGVALAPFKFIVHKPQIKMGLPIRGGLARLACVAYMLKGYTMRDWWAFMEVFGMPLRVGQYGESATEAQKTTLLNAAASIGTDAACIIPENMRIEFIEASKTSGGDRLFIAAADWIDKQVSKGVLGQTMTTDDGSSLSQAKVHDMVRGDIQRSDAKQAGAVIRRDLVKPFVDLNFGVQENYPYVRLVIDQPEDLKEFSTALAPMIDRGLKVQASIVLDKFGLAEAEEGAELLVPEASASQGFGGQPVEGAARAIAARTSTTVQSVICSKKVFESAGAARKWITDHGFHATKLDETETSYRFRQRDPDEFKDGSLRTIELTRGVKAVIGVLLSATAAAKRDEDDQIDVLVQQALGDWRPAMDPVLHPIVALARSSGSYAEFLDGLEQAMAEADTDEFTRRLAIEGLKARGLGDETG